jgi:hypothetical protein
MKKNAWVICSVLAGLVSQPAAAIWLSCNFVPDNFYVFSSGDVYFKSPLRSDWYRICNTEGTLNSISSLTCANWTAMFKAAASRPPTVGAQQINITFNVASGTCTTIAGDASTPPVLYVMAYRS